MVTNYKRLWYRYRRENNRLSTDYTKLQGSYRDLELQGRAQHEKQLKQKVRDQLNISW
jgi:hypothetical protein